jgi:RimJ/RimL family protein N-acetyltransferase
MKVTLDFARMMALPRAGRALLSVAHWQRIERRDPPRSPAADDQTGRRIAPERTARLLDVVIQTERLLLRRVTIDDVHELVAIHSDPDITRFMGPFDRVEAINWLHRVDQNWHEHGYGRIAITDRTTGHLLGRTGLLYLPQFTETELGWTLRRDAWGHGYALEAARACVDWAFRDFEIPYLTSLIEPNNERSIRVAGRLGMTPLRNDVFHDRRMIVHCVARDTWLRSQQAKPA